MQHNACFKGVKLVRYQLTNHYWLRHYISKLKSPNQVDSYTGIIKDYSKMANAWHLAMPSGNSAQTSLFDPFAELATRKDPTHILPH